MRNAVTMTYYGTRWGEELQYSMGVAKGGGVGGGVLRLEAAVRYIAGRAWPKGIASTPSRRGRWRARGVGIQNSTNDGQAQSRRRDAEPGEHRRCSDRATAFWRSTGQR